MMKADLEYFRTDEIISGCSASALRSKIKNFYNNQFGVSPTVSLECELSDGSRTSACDSAIDVVEHIYTI